MTVNVAFGGSDRMAGGDAPLPSLVSSEFRQSSDVGFMRVVEEASRASPHSQLTIGNMEPFLRKRGQSPASLTPGSGWETPRNGKESLTFDWSRNISKVRNARRPHSRMSPKEGSRGRSSSQPSASVTSRRPTARWRGDGLMTPSKADAVTRHEECSEMVVDITSRDPSPLTRMLPVKWPSVVSLHGRPPSGRRRNRRNSLTKEKNKTKFPQINGNIVPGLQMPAVPLAQDINKQGSAADLHSMGTKNLWGRYNPRKPAESRRPVRPGTLRSPVKVRSPRNSMSKPYDGISLLQNITTAAEALCVGTAQMTLDWESEESPLQEDESEDENQHNKGKQLCVESQHDTLPYSTHNTAHGKYCNNDL